MKSFDLFRTLTFARNGQPGEDTVESHYPIAENVAKVQSGDIVVSEYEDYRRDKARAILSNIGLPNTQLITTEDGKTTGHIWPHLKSQGYDITEHTGDNQLQDVLGPQKHGIKGTHVTQHNFTKNESALLPIFPNLANAMRKARLTTWHPDPLQRQRQLLQIEANFPLLFCASLLLNRQLKDETVLMSSRDCFLWKSVMAFLKDRTDAKYKIEYFYTSRLCREFPSKSYLEYVSQLLTNAVVVDLCGTGRSLSLLLQRVAKPDTPIYFITQYSRHFMEQAYGPAKLGDIKTFIPNLQGANLERANLAQHAMVSEAGLTDFNPCNIYWQMPEITAQHEAFDTCIGAAHWYPLDLEATDQQLQGAIQVCCQWIREYDSCMEFATKFLKDEDVAVMARLKELSCKK